MTKRYQDYLYLIILLVLMAVLLLSKPASAQSGTFTSEKYVVTIGTTQQFKPDSAGFKNAVTRAKKLSRQYNQRITIVVMPGVANIGNSYVILADSVDWFWMPTVKLTGSNATAVIKDTSIININFAGSPEVVNTTDTTKKIVTDPSTVIEYLFSRTATGDTTLGSVDLTDPEANEVLIYDGTDWINATLTEANIATITSVNAKLNASDSVKYVNKTSIENINAQKNFLGGVKIGSDSSLYSVEGSTHEKFKFDRKNTSYASIFDITPTDSTNLGKFGMGTVGGGTSNANFIGYMGYNINRVKTTEPAWYFALENRYQSVAPGHEGNNWVEAHLTYLDSITGAEYRLMTAFMDRTDPYASFGFGVNRFMITPNEYPPTTIPIDIIQDGTENEYSLSLLDKPYMILSNMRLYNKDARDSSWLFHAGYELLRFGSHSNGSAIWLNPNTSLPNTRIGQNLIAYSNTSNKNRVSLSPNGAVTYLTNSEINFYTHTVTASDTGGNNVFHLNTQTKTLTLNGTPGSITGAGDLYVDDVIANDITLTDGIITITDALLDPVTIQPIGGIAGNTGIRTGETVQVEGESPSFGYKIGANISDIVPPGTMTGSWDWAFPDRSGTIAMTDEYMDTLSYNWGVMDTVTTGVLPGWKLPNNITIVEIAAYTDANTVTFNIEERAETTPNTAGTDAMASDLVADTDQQESTSFTNANFDKNTWMVPTISATGDVAVFSITVKYIKR